MCSRRDFGGRGLWRKGDCVQSSSLHRFASTFHQSLMSSISFCVPISASSACWSRLRSARTSFSFRARSDLRIFRRMAEFVPLSMLLISPCSAFSRLRLYASISRPLSPAEARSSGARGTSRASLRVHSRVGSPDGRERFLPPSTTVEPGTAGAAGPGAPVQYRVTVRLRAREAGHGQVCYASPPRNRSIAPPGSVRARVMWPCYVIANGVKGSHYPSRPNCLA